MMDLFVSDLALALDDPKRADDALDRARHMVQQLQSEATVMAMALRATEAELARRSKQAAASAADDTESPRDDDAADKDP